MLNAPQTPNAAIRLIALNFSPFDRAINAATPLLEQLRLSVARLESIDRSIAAPKDVQRFGQNGLRTSDRFGLLRQVFPFAYDR